MSNKLNKFSEDFHLVERRKNNVQCDVKEELILEESEDEEGDDEEFHDVEDSKEDW